MTEPSKTPRTDAIDASRVSSATPQFMALLDLARELESAFSDSQRRADDAQAAESIAQLAVERVREYAEAFARHIASEGVGHPSGDASVLLCVECGARGRNRPSVAHDPKCIVGKAQVFVAAHSRESDADRAALANGEIPAHLASPNESLEIGRSIQPFDKLQDLAPFAPVCWIRTLNGKPDWAEDCVSEDEHSLRSNLPDSPLAEGYDVMPLYARLHIDDSRHQVFRDKEPTR